MSLLDTSKIGFAFKALAQKIHSDNAKEPANEAISSGLTVAGSTVFGEAIPATPSNTALYDITNGKVEFVRLEMTVDPSANGHNFIARLPADYETNSSNPKKGSGFFVNSQVLSSTAGAVQIVPPLFGLNYEMKPYRGGTAAKGTGTLVPPGDAIDWLGNYFAGTVFQENSPDMAPANITYLECFIWIGPMVVDLIGDVSNTISDLIVRGTHTVGVPSSTEVVDILDLTKYSTAKWIITAKNNPYLFSTEILASYLGGDSTWTPFAQLTLGSPADNFCEFDVDSTGSSLRLLVSSSLANTIINVTRINIL